MTTINICYAGIMTTVPTNFEFVANAIEHISNQIRERYDNEVIRNLWIDKSYINSWTHISSNKLQHFIQNENNKFVVNKQKVSWQVFHRRLETTIRPVVTTFDTSVEEFNGVVFQVHDDLQYYLDMVIYNDFSELDKYKERIITKYTSVEHFVKLCKAGGYVNQSILKHLEVEMV